MTKKIGILIIVVSLCLGSAFAGALLGKSLDDKHAYNQGYARGLLVMANDMATATDETVNSATMTDDYEHFANIKHMSFYILTKNGVKTIAKYE